VAEHPTQTAAVKEHYLLAKADNKGLLHYDIDRQGCTETAEACDNENLNHGILEMSREDLTDLVVATDAEGIAVHFHALADAAVDASLSAIEAARVANPKSQLPHNLSHLQQVDAADFARFGQAGAYITPSMSWFLPNYAYDISVIPYFDEHKSIADLQDLYDQDRDYIKKFYPIKSLMDGGAIISAGSDVPVDSPTPRPFTDIMAGLMRGEWILPPQIDEKQAKESDYVWQVMNAEERLSIESLLDSYTINGAKAMRQEDLTGSLEVGKKADVVILNQDIIAAAKTMAADADYSDGAYSICDAWYDDHCKTKVDATILDGQVVFGALVLN